jgi:hypothetical protein
MGKGHGIWNNRGGILYEGMIEVKLYLSVVILHNSGIGVFKSPGTVSLVTVLMWDQQYIMWEHGILDLPVLGWQGGSDISI